MGCVSSKVLTKSRSFQEELNLSLQRRTNGVPGLEDLIANKNGGDPFLALLRTANSVATKLKAGNAALEQGKSSLRPTEPEQEEKVVTTKTNASDEATGPETIDARDLMAGLDEEEEGGEQEQEQKQEQGQAQHQQQQVLRHPQETARSGSLRKTHTGHEVADGDCEGIVRTRSFRTVEDLDAMVAGNSALLPLPVAGEEEEQSTNGGAEKAPEKLDEFKCSEINVQPELSESDPAVWSRSSSRGESAGAEANVAGNRSYGEQKRLRRRAMGRELRTLKVPSFEFSSVGSLREWLDGGGQVFSPGSYVTPRFGNVGGSQGGGAARSGDSGVEEAVFDPQLVADLEEAMERLTMEEEHILREIVEGLQGSHEADADDPEVDRHT